MEMFRGAHLKKVVANTVVQLALKFLTSGTTLAATLLISYFLGLTAFGSFTKIVTFVSFFYLIVDFGINAIFIKKIEDVKKNLFNLILLRLTLASFLFLILTILTFALPYNSINNTGFSDSEKLGVLIFGLNIFAQGVYLSLNSIIQKNLAYKKAIAPGILFSIITIVLIFIGVQLKNLDLILFSYFVSSTITVFLLFKKIKKSFGVKLEVFNFGLFSKGLLFSSFPLALALFLNLIYSKADIFILSLNKSTLEVGVYGLSYRFFEFLIAVPAFFSNSIYPILLDTKEENLFNALVKKYFGVLLLSAIILMIVTIFLSPLLPLIKHDYSLSVAPLKILSLSLPFFFATSLLQWLFIIKNKVKTLIVIYASAMLVNIFLNIVFIPLYSYTASSVVTVVSEALVLVLMLTALGLQKVKNT